jgi:5-deoxy-glucuronate isomerase
MALHLTQHRGGFETGLTEITQADEEVDSTGIGLAVLKLVAGQEFKETAAAETAWLLMDGPVTAEVGGRSEDLERTSLFDESATCLHVPAGAEVCFSAHGPVEFTRYSVANEASFASRFFFPDDVPNEHRGRGQVGGTCLRFVRTIFDGANSEAGARLVLGEVVTMPGRWSSYPPHHHAQPEIYHYRFTEPQGYGHAELGETVLKVKQYDTVKIFDGFDHAQCAAPGYGMYYSWVIRHLPDNPYTSPDFTEEHRWIMEDGAEFWAPASVADDG